MKCQVVLDEESHALLQELAQHFASMQPWKPIWMSWNGSLLFKE
jgi:hypothetical protein